MFFYRTVEVLGNDFWRDLNKGGVSIVQNTLKNEHIFDINWRVFYSSLYINRIVFLCVCVVIKLLPGKYINIDMSYMDRCRIYREVFLSIIQVKILTCACAVEFCGFLKKYSKYFGGLIGFERKLDIAYPMRIYIFTPGFLQSQTRACAYYTFSKIQSILFLITHWPTESAAVIA